MPQVQRIDPIVLPSEKESVAAYCRVSTDSKDQLNSYHAQISYYTQLINDNPDWVLYDLYADRGITGTSMEKRDEFKRMLADCREGKIKRILVKSVSRFARNTTELLETTRELKDLGVVVVFEEQGYDTSQMMSEMLLTMYAMAAQEESSSISKNMIWSYRRRMENGTFIGTRAPYGYELVDGTLKVVSNEAEIVNRIYQMYLSGTGLYRIALTLNDEKIPAKGIDHWTYSAVRYVLSNERYIGNALLQKKYTEDALTHKRRNNHGERQQYYVENCHEPIISGDVFSKVQTLLKKRNIFQGLSKHSFTHKILCPDCGKHYRRMVCRGKCYWICVNRVQKQSKCLPYRFTEDTLEKAALNMMTKLYLECDFVIQPIIALLHETEYKQTGDDSKLFELDQRIAAINDKSLTLQKLSSKGFISADEYRAQNEKLAVERQKLSALRNKKLHGLQSHSAIEKLEELQAILSSWLGIPTEFDIEQFDDIVEKIIPTEDNKLIFRLHCGLELTEEIPS